MKWHFFIDLNSYCYQLKSQDGKVFVLWNQDSFPWPSLLFPFLPFPSFPLPSSESKICDHFITLKPDVMRYLCNIMSLFTLRNRLGVSCLFNYGIPASLIKILNKSKTIIYNSFCFPHGLFWWVNTLRYNFLISVHGRFICLDRKSVV